MLLQVCSTFSALIESNILLQYKMELHVHCMLDMPSSRMPIAERLDRLRQHGRNLALARFSCTNFTPPRVTENEYSAPRPLSDGSIAYYTRKGNRTKLAVKRMPSSSRSLRKEEPLTMLPYLLGKDYLVTDIAQDLVIMVDGSGDGIENK